MKAKFWLLYIVCLFLVTEASLQFFYRFTTGTYLYVRDKPPLYASDPYSGWTNQPFLAYRHVTPEFSTEIYTNGEGFRVSSAQEEYQKKRPSNTFRILLLGPSFAFGWGVNFEDSFGAHLQRLLAVQNFANGSRIEVLNHGVPGLPAANELEWLKQVGKDYRPDLVVHFTYGSFEVIPKPETNVAVHNGLVVQSNAGIKELVWGYAKNAASVFYTGIVINRVSKAVSKDISAMRIEGAGREMRNSPTFSIQDPLISDSVIFYRTLRETVEAAGAKLLIVYFPLAYVVHPEDRMRWVLQGVQNIEEQIQFNRTFASFLNENGFRCLNVTEQFVQRAKTEKQRLYYWLDVHWTASGNVLAAQLVADYLQCDKSRKYDTQSNCLSLSSRNSGTEEM